MPQQTPEVRSTKGAGKHSRANWHSRLLMQLRRERCPGAPRGDRRQAADGYRAPSAKADRCRAPFSRPSGGPRECVSHSWRRKRHHEPQLWCDDVATMSCGAALASQPSRSQPQHRQCHASCRCRLGPRSARRRQPLSRDGQAAARRMACFHLPLSPHGP